jgi:hypothetical protein
MPITCRVERKIDINHRLMKCTFCEAEHIVEVKVKSNGNWSSPRGSRDCRNPQCQSHQIQAAAKAAALLAKATALQEKAIAATPEYYDQPLVF